MNNRNILYVAGNYFGAQYQCIDYLLHTDFNVRVAAYNIHSHIPEIWWSLDALPYPSAKEQLIQDLTDWKPTLAIIDYDSEMSWICQELNIPIIKCSPLHLIDGIEKFNFKNYKTLINSTLKCLSKIPYSEYNFIYSPFSFINDLRIKNDYEWISPYTYGLETGQDTIAIVNRNVDKISNFVDKITSTKRGSVDYIDDMNNCHQVLSSGETAVITDAILNGKKLCITPDIKNAENCINAIICQQYNIGRDLGQIEYLNYLAADEVTKGWNTTQKLYEPKEAKFLDQRIEEIWKSL